MPMDAAAHHRQVANIIFNEALEKAGVSDSDIEAIAVSNAPGLAPCLLAGMEFAKIKAKELKVSIVPVNHCIAHLEIGRHEGAKKIRSCCTLLELIHRLLLLLREISRIRRDA